MSENEDLIRFARDLANPDFSLSVPTVAKGVINKLLAALEPLPTPPSPMAERDPDARDPEWIVQQRIAGWPDMHPEDFCHRCGTRNMLWAAATREVWLAGTSKWAAETGREGICCPRCFADMHADQTGHSTIWIFSPHVADRADGESGPEALAKSDLIVAAKDWLDSIDRDASAENEVDASILEDLIKGYRREPEPREVTTVEELDALPLRSFIREYDGFHRLKEIDGEWLLCIQSGGRSSSNEIELPATVLFTPSTEQPS
ncbi:MAG: hypothetical protein H7288_11340 [Kineosporiaceae bacterium]|nr:hypothetical protein [Aeromicrobium sp.]